MTLGSTQPLTEMSTRNLPWGKGRSARKENMGASTSHNPIGFHGLLRGELYLFRPFTFSFTLKRKAPEVLLLTAAP
jgi:hypothetical protein